ncbi:MAG: DUF4911 domain-containing protein [Deltaproteobacteria bacterium]|nr:DUF4911 domain-containing protein [Deltaproteobacteria bacterium]
MDLHEIYLETDPKNVAYVKFVIESYEEVGIIRTVYRKQAVIVLLTMPAYLEVARQIISSLEKEISIRVIPRPAEKTDDWLMLELEPANNTPDDSESTA